MTTTHEISFKDAPDRRWKKLNFCLLMLYNITFYTFMKNIWPWLEENFEKKSDRLRMITIPLIFVSFMCTYVFFTILYYFEFPFFEQFKVNNEDWPWKTDKEFPKKIKKCLLVVLRNLITGTIVSGILNKMTKTRYDSESFPSFFNHLWQYFLCDFMTSFFFYWGHRFLHLPFMYKYAHKQHHEFYNTIVYCSSYTHPIEFVLANLLPKFIIMFSMGPYMHYMTFYCYLFSSILRTNETHSGYEFPISMNNWNPLEGASSFHNFHHFKNMGNYGSYLGIMDKIFQTDLPYKKFMKELNEKWAKEENAKKNK